MQHRPAPYRQPSAQPLALYVHWPFCLAKCPYCDFNSHVRARVDTQAWERALLADLDYEFGAVRDAGPIGSIFFGGGTPSLMPPALVAKLIERADERRGLLPDCEITLEANPSSVEAERFAELASAGVNRVSLGLQALNDADLRFLGRLHGANEGIAALDVAQRHFGRVSFDLIYARPGQSGQAWREELERAIGFGTTHLSLYQLTIEPGTRFATDVRRGAFAPLDDDAAADLFVMTREMTVAANLPAYEISNFAQPGQESRHNLTYWRYGDYCGIGPGAHGRRRGAATQRHRKPENWMAAIDRQGHGIESETPLAAEERATEALLMGLRLAEGVDPAGIAQRTGLPEASLLDPAKVALHRGNGLLWQEGSRIGATEDGIRVLDALLAEIVATARVAA
ncbi:radical SAM family heme chaperone HemW [Qipengyuania sp. JC766]|uniref:radical SAM family heme chaperone HemW n=1 Tax=Qipengyuania sp. JC766 TaxID=3232139 RepID=UPI00345ABDAF